MTCGATRRWMVEIWRLARVGYYGWWISKVESQVSVCSCWLCSLVPSSGLVPRAQTTSPWNDGSRPFAKRNSCRALAGAPLHPAPAPAPAPRCLHAVRLQAKKLKPRVARTGARRKKVDRREASSPRDLSLPTPYTWHDAAAYCSHKQDIRRVTPDPCLWFSLFGRRVKTR